MYTFQGIWHRSLRLGSHPGLQGTPLDAHRDDSMLAARFSKNYDTIFRSWPLMYQNVIFSDETMNSPHQ